MYHDKYDPDLHGDAAPAPPPDWDSRVSPPANRGMALAVVLAIVGVPLVLWFALAS